MRQPKSASAFTLVELLVVIGIIGLLISILLPALGAARRQANAVKCAAGLRDLGNAFKFYAQEHKNYYPPAQLTSGSATGAKYELDGVEYPVPVGTGTVTYGAYWFNFLNKYITKTNLGASANTQQGAADARRSLVWGCPAFDGYASSASTMANFDTNPVQTGYCMNGYPTFNAGYPAGTTVFPPVTEYSYQTDWGQPVSTANPVPYRGGFIKATIWGKRGAERMLLADGKLWLGETGRVNPLTFKGEVPTQNSADENKTRGSNETYISLWRHGKTPAAKEGGYYRVTGSKVGFNVLYADGHVNTETEGKVAYTSTRMKYPG